MRYSLICCLAITCFAGFANAAHFWETNATSNGTCAECTVALGFIRRYTNSHSVSVEQFLKDDLCTLFPPFLQIACDTFVDEFGDKIINAFENETNPDDICLNFFDACDYPQCRLFGKPHNAVITQGKNAVITQGNRVTWPNPFNWIKNAIKKVADDHMALFDHDSDSFSTSATLRGYDWKGRDCDDKRDDVYPGRMTTQYGDDVDHDCNGIFGVDNEGHSYEEKWCSNSSRLGIIALGDSVTAKFRCPPSYINGSAVDSNTYEGILRWLEDEGDFPQYSLFTGHELEPENPFPMNMSMYGRLLERNWCNFRDYQNYGVNGLHIGDVNDTILPLAFRRDTKNDWPVLCFLALVGNDICNKEHDTLAHMTTPEEWEARLLDTLAQLDERLPPGSHVFIILQYNTPYQWDLLHNKEHPIDDSVTYSDFYGYLNCLGLNPCTALLNADESIRLAAVERANQFNNITAAIVKRGGYSYDMDAIHLPIKKGMEWMESQGYTKADAFEPVDGFHPSSIANHGLSIQIWDYLVENHADWLGPINPYNQDIFEKFGDQGGY